MNLSLASENLKKEFPQHSEYIELQKTWNESVLQYLKRWVSSSSKVISIGSFLGAPEFVLSEQVDSILCCDLDDYLPKKRPSNISFRQINLDSLDLNLPLDQHFDLCICVEVLEHLRWSPLPMLKWMRLHCNLLVISTPDDYEWPPVEDAPWTTKKHFRDIPFAEENSMGNPKPMSHCKQYSQTEFIELLDVCGFRVIELQRVGVGGHQMVAVAAARNEPPPTFLKFELTCDSSNKNSINLMEKALISIKDHGFVLTLKKISAYLSRKN